MTSRGGGEFGTERGLTLLVLDRVAIARMFLPTGMVFRWSAELGREVEADAKALLTPGHGVSLTGSHGEPPGTLRRSVGHSTVPVLEGVQVNVRATARSAVFYIKGTRPHVIESSRTTTYRSGPNAGQVGQGWMKFFWIRAGKIVYAQHVNHPGFRGRNFLNEAKDAVLLRRGITRV